MQLIQSFPSIYFIGNEKVAELLIKAGANVNAMSNKLSWTPLFSAVVNGKKHTTTTVNNLKRT